MKIKSDVNSDSYFELWKTPIGDASNLKLCSILQTGLIVHFFFSKDESKSYHVMTIARLCPYKIVEEKYAASCIGKFLLTKNSDENDLLSIDQRAYKTWKMWGTTFINELDENTALSEYKHERDKNIFSCLVKTSKEWIEFVNEEPDWAVYDNISLKDLINLHLDEKIKFK